MKTNQDQRIEEELRIISSFRIHFSIYVIVVGVFWALWLWLEPHSVYTWPLYLTAGWGFAVLIHYIGAYMAVRKRNRIS